MPFPTQKLPPKQRRLPLPAAPPPKKGRQPPWRTTRPGAALIRELDDRKKQVAKRLVRNFVESGIELLYQDSECDKYAFEHEARIDCLSRLPICKAVCCKFPFTLSKQDVVEGLSHWELGRLYLISHDDIHAVEPVLR